jgi:hypothetical protein
MDGIDTDTLIDLKRKYTQRVVTGLSILLVPPYGISPEDLAELRRRVQVLNDDLKAITAELNKRQSQN